ncbi:hypothetical protein F4679DRAFT_586065 [Xylaria curta]|nr:hypothetical protein F4679DRAFT_586065 [Xylaria curta]
MSAVNSGIRNLPMLLSVIVASLIPGGLITAFGHSTPFMIFSIVLAAIGSGLLTTWTPNTNTATWIGYQIIFGLGVGAVYSAVSDLPQPPSGFMSGLAELYTARTEPE